MEAQPLAGALVVHGLDGSLPEAAPAMGRLVLTDQHIENVYRFVAMVARTDQDSADLAQEALTRAVRSIHRYDPAKGAPEAWLWRIVVNVARDAGRASVRRQTLRE